MVNCIFPVNSPERMMDLETKTKQGPTRFNYGENSCLGSEMAQNYTPSLSQSVERSISPNSRALSAAARNKKSSFYFQHKEAKEEENSGEIQSDEVSESIRPHQGVYDFYHHLASRCFRPRCKSAL